jgi:hypothetical protein
MAVTTDETSMTPLSDLPTAELDLPLLQDENAAIWERPALPVEERPSILNSLRGCS